MRMSGPVRNYWVALEQHFYLERALISSTGCSRHQAGVQNEIPGVLPTGQHLKSLLSYNDMAVVTPNPPMLSVWGKWNVSVGAPLPPAPCRLQGGHSCFLGWCQVFPETAAHVTLFLLSSLCHPSSCGSYSKHTVFCLLSLGFVSLGFSQHL